MTEGPYNLPAEWRWVQLGEVCTYEKKSIDPRRAPQRRFRLYSIPAYDSGKCPQLLRGSEVGSGKLLIKPGICLFSKLNPRIPRAWAVHDEGFAEDLVASMEFMPLRPDSSRLMLQFLEHVLMSEVFLNQVREDVSGATGSRQRLKPDTVLSALIPLPPLNDQERIVARIDELLGRIREARRLRKEAIRDAERLWESTLADTFPRPGANLPVGWRWVRLGEVCIVNPRRPRLSRDPQAPTTFVPMSAVDELTGTITAAETKPFGEVRRGYTYFAENDILFAKITPCMENGKSAIAKGLLDGIGFGSTEFHVLRPTGDVLPEWVWLFVRRKNFRAAAKAAFRGGVGQQRVPAEFLQQSYIPLPPLPEQRRIVADLDAVQEMVRALKKSQAETETELQRLEQSVLDRAFRGEL